MNIEFLCTVFSLYLNCFENKDYVHIQKKREKKKEGRNDEEGNLKLVNLCNTM